MTFDGLENTKKNERKGVYTFSQAKSYMFIVNNGGKICLLVLLFMISIALVKKENIDSLSRSLHVIIFLCVLMYITGRFLKKFAFKIIVDFESQNIRFYMNRSTNVIVANFDDVRSLCVNGYIIFILKTRKIFYSGVPNKKILTCLRKIKKIQWGFLCALLGPSKDLRDAVEGA
jgi:hypothetical protein